MDQTVYVDTLFLTNFIINYLLLLATAGIASLEIRRFRLAISAVLGGLYSVFMFFPQVGFMYTLSGKVLMAAVMTLIAFYMPKILTIFRVTLIFFAVSFAFGGCIIGLSTLARMSGSLVVKNGVPYMNISPLVIIVTAAGSYLLFSLLFKRRGGNTISKTGEDLYIEFEGRTASLPCLIDSGSTLSDPVTNTPVVVIDREYAKRLLPTDLRSAMAGYSADNAAEVVFSLSGSKYERFFRLIPFKTIGQEHGLLLAFRPDKVVLGGKKRGRMLIAVSPTGVCDNSGFKAIAGL